MQISLQNVTKTFQPSTNKKKAKPAVTAVSGLNLDVEKGEFLVLMGPSGCGKTTTLRLIAGLELPDEGEIFFNDVCVNTKTPAERRVAMVFQTFALYPHLTVYKNIAFGLTTRKRLPKPEIDQKVRRIAHVLDIDFLLDRKPKILSIGQRQRVSLARALVREPDICLLDEPLSNLDANLRAELRGELMDLHKRLNVTFIYVTHDQNDALMGDRIAVMKDGQIIQLASQQELYENPCNSFVASMIGTPPINLLPGKLCGDSLKYGVEIGNQRLPVASKRVNDAMRARLGQPIVIGIRPEDLHSEPEFIAAHPESVISATVDHREYLGDGRHMYINWQDRRLLARMLRYMTAGSDIKLAADPEKIHLFFEEE